MSGEDKMTMKNKADGLKSQSHAVDNPDLASEIAEHWKAADRNVPAFGSKEFQEWIKRDYPGFLDWFSGVTNWTVERLREGGYRVENFEELQVALVKLSIMPADDAMEAAN